MYVYAFFVMPSSEDSLPNLDIPLESSGVDRFQVDMCGYPLSHRTNTGMLPQFKFRVFPFLLYWRVK